MPFSNEKDESGTDKDVAADDESRAELESLIIRGLLGRNGGDDNGEGSVPDPATLTSPDNDSGDGVLDRKFFGGIKVLVASPVVDEDDRPRTPQRALKCDRNNDRVRERISLAFILVGFMVVDLVAVVPAVVIIIVIVLVVWPMHTHTQTEREREREGLGWRLNSACFFHLTFVVLRLCLFLLLPIGPNKDTTRCTTRCHQKHASAEERTTRDEARTREREILTVGAR